MAAAVAVTPAVGAWRLCCSLLLGGCLGIFYGFLRPLGRRHRHLADVLFALGAMWIWLYLSFAVCRGDIRPVYLLGLGCGTLLWEKTVNFWLRPVYFGFWEIIAGIFRIFLFPWKKILEFAKILFASAEKWVTIKCIKLYESLKKRRKEPHGKFKHPAKNCESGNSSRIQYP